jgi:hypothetical protein
MDKAGLVSDDNLSQIYHVKNGGKYKYQQL